MLRAILWALIAVPGLFFIASGVSHRLHIRHFERLEREFDVYPLGGETVRVVPRGTSGRFTAVVADPDQPSQDLIGKDAVKFSWRRADSGPFERPSAGVLEVPHHGQPMDLVYSSLPKTRAVLRVYPEGRPEMSPRMQESERFQWLCAGLWLVPWAALLACNLRSQRPVISRENRLR